MASVGKRDKKVARPPCSLERQLIKRPSTKRKQRGADRVKPFTQAPRDATGRLK